MQLHQPMISGDVEVRFFNNESGWYANAFFDPSSDVHQKCGICFKTPAYFDQKVCFNCFFPQCPSHMRK